MKEIRLNKKDLLLLKQIPKSNPESNLYVLGNDLLKIYNISQTEKNKIKQRVELIDETNIKETKNFLWLNSEIYINESFSGFSMKYLRDYDVIAKMDYKHPHILKILKDLSTSLKTIHEKEVYIGDLNTHNVMYKGSKSFFIDTDSINYQNKISNSISKFLYDFGFSNISDKTDNFSLAYIALILITDYDAFAKNRMDLIQKVEQLQLHKDLSFLKEILIKEENIYLSDHIDNFKNFEYNKDTKKFEKKQ